MANTVFMSKTGLIGGEATKLDSIDGAVLVDGDAAFVNVLNVQYIYRLDADSGAVESSPNIIAPDTNAGDKRWILQTPNHIGAWVDYSSTSTVTGWSAGLTKKIYYKIVEKVVFVDFYITGTSNDYMASFTIPHTPAHSLRIACHTMVFLDDNTTTYAIGYAANSGANATIDLYQSATVGGPWTDSGIKTVQGQFFYSIA
jgi:hypothetical protein